ncbi:MAG: hypothetical protein QOH82_75 [Mycobacterium sp.]|nr:hypothetical protein [Mycobacterium sp.]
MSAHITATELRDRLSSGTPPRLLDVRSPAEFETAHIAGAFNVPLDVVRERPSEITERLEGGIAEWEGNGFDVDRGIERWDIERQVRLVAGLIVLSSVVGSVLVPKLKWLAAAIGGGLTFAAASNTCAMGTALSKLPYNRTADYDPAALVSRLG